MILFFYLITIVMSGLWALITPSLYMLKSHRILTALVSTTVYIWYMFPPLAVTVLSILSTKKPMYVYSKQHDHVSFFIDCWLVVCIQKTSAPQFQSE